MVTFWNHTGTHIDGPAHVLADREPFTSCCPGTGLYFTNPGVIDVPCDDSRLITARDLEARGTGDREFDLLLIRTGYSKHRTVDQARYAERNPGISVAAARFLAEQFHRLGCIGIDAISFAAAEHLNEGLEAHRILLDREPPVLLLEDVNLDYNLRALTKVMVIPFFIEDIDSCPCTVVAEFAGSTARVRTG